MSYRTKIEARIQANKNRIKDKQAEVVHLKAEINEICLTNDYLSDMVAAEIAEEEGNLLVYCTHCLHFFIDENEVPRCKHEKHCSIEDPEDSVQKKERPYYRPDVE